MRGGTRSQYVLVVRLRRGVDHLDHDQRLVSRDLRPPERAVLVGGDADRPGFTQVPRA
jgi:hypothetical protein